MFNKLIYSQAIRQHGGVGSSDVHAFIKLKLEKKDINQLKLKRRVC